MGNVSLQGVDGAGHTLRLDLPEGAARELYEDLKRIFTAPAAPPAFQCGTVVQETSDPSTYYIVVTPEEARRINPNVERTTYEGGEFHVAFYDFWTHTLTAGMVPNADASDYRVVSSQLLAA